MPDVKIETPVTLDLLEDKSPALSATSDMPVIETKPDATPAEPKAEEVVEAAPEGAEETEEPAAPETEAKPSENAPRKPAKGVQKRLDELTRARHEAEARAESERAEKLRLLAMLEKQAAPAETQQTEPELIRPTRAQFGDEASYESALEEYISEKSARIASAKAEEVMRQKAEDERKAQEAQERESVRQTYASRVEKAKEKYADYAEVAESPNVSISANMAHAIVHSEEGPEVAYFLGKNPAEAERISKLSPALQLVELGKQIGRAHV